MNSPPPEDGVRCGQVRSAGSIPAAALKERRFLAVVDDTGKRNIIVFSPIISCGI